TLAAGAARLKIVKRIVRCPAVNVDPDTAMRDLEIPATLSRHLGHMDCGIYAEVIADGEIGLGDTIAVEQPRLVPSPRRASGLLRFARNDEEDTLDSRNRDRAARQAVIARSAATKQSRIPPREDSGLLRCAGNDDEDTWVRPITARVPRTLCFAAHPRHATVRTTPPWATSRRHSL
ncbi:hypothetical protein E4T56_gene14118, partial [Termitomyces sp. T112]